MSELVYGLVREFLQGAPPASRNQAFEAYEDPRFARAVRIYQFLASVKDDLEALRARGAAVKVSVLDEGARVALVLAYETERICRTAYLSPEEWALLSEAPGFEALLEALGAPPVLSAP